VTTCADKEQRRRVSTDDGYRTPHFAESDTPSRIEEAYRSERYPLITKNLSKVAGADDKDLPMLTRFQSRAPGFQTSRNLDAQRIKKKPRNIRRFRRLVLV
jgi:hypothetical protein